MRSKEPRLSPQGDPRDGLVAVNKDELVSARSLLDEMRKRVPMSKARRAELNAAIREIDEALLQDEERF